MTKKEFPLFKCIVDGENCIQTIEDKEEQEKARTMLTTQIGRHMNNTTMDNKEKAILHTVEQTKSFLNKNKHIIITNADKGNVTVAMERKEYEDKMKTILRDRTTYRIMRSDPTLKLQKINNEIVEKLYKEEIISNMEKHNLIQRTSYAPRIYGNP